MLMNVTETQPRRIPFEQALKERLLILDGSTGVEFQRRALSESEVRGRRFMTHTRSLASNFDILCLSRPEIVAEVHRSYLEAGADIIETNTFNSNRLSQSEYGTAGLVREINRAGAAIARAEADRYSAQGKTRYVAGAVGPTALSASLPVDVDDLGARAVDFDTLAEAYTDQIAGLIEGGVDFLLIETIFDLLNAKAAAEGAQRAMELTGKTVPVVYSFTISDRSGRILSGHTPEAILSTIAPFSPAAVGFNCSAGPEGLTPIVKDLACRSPFPIIFYPNAGLPDRMGNYTVGPEAFASEMRDLLKDGVLNIAGGCCGTGPEHIRALAGTAATCGATPRHADPSLTPAWLAGLDAFAGNRGFINVGERCNVAGSRKFLRLIKEKNISEALGIARKQVADGAMILDINMDDGMLDSCAEMCAFLRALGSDPVTSAVPWMIDSSDFSVISEALKNIGGRAIVNSISLKHGTEEFISRARAIRRAGAAVVVMLFDERGQADTLERKMEISRRAIGILTEKCGFPRRDIVIDPNVLAIATGMPEHNAYARWFIDAVATISAEFPGVRTSGGISNLSFAFRGNNYLRQAMHAVFLYHGVKAGLSMGIVDPGTKVQYADIAPELLKRLEAAVLNAHPGACDELAAVAADYTGVAAGSAPTETADTTQQPVEQRLITALKHGDDSRLADDLAEAVERAGDANTVVEHTLMDGMEEVGRLFEAGKMFLPQVVKSARTMHRAVEILTPWLEKGRGGATKGTVLLATVKGDVHDIGKNIAAVVLRCNNYEVIDLGVQVESRAIIDAINEYEPDFVGLSGLISPSLEEMARTLTAMRQAGFTVPVFVGGAATSELHTALRLAPAYGEGLVIRVADASRNPIVAGRLQRDFASEYTAIRRDQRRRAKEYEESLLPAAESDAPLPEIDWEKEPMQEPTFTGVRTLSEIPIAEGRPYINNIYFFNCWKVTPGSPEAAELLADAEALLDRLEKEGATMRAQVGFYEAYSDGETIYAGNEEIFTPRQRATAGRKECVALADYIAPEDYDDYIGCFAVSIGDVLRKALDRAIHSDDEYQRLLLQSVCDRLAEATSEMLHRRVRTELWGYAPDEPLDFDAIRHGRYRGIRPAVGYPSLPDQHTMHTLLRLLRPTEIGIEATENGALIPSSSVAGFYFSSPRARYFTL